MPENYKGYILNKENDPAPWSGRENTLFKKVIDDKIETSEKGASEGVAPLVGGKVPEANLPTQISEHNDTTNRNANDAHPISAITGLKTALDSFDGWVTAYDGVPYESLGAGSGVFLFGRSKAVVPTAPNAIGGIIRITITDDGEEVSTVVAYQNDGYFSNGTVNGFANPIYTGRFSDNLSSCVGSLYMTAYNDPRTTRAYIGFSYENIEKLPDNVKIDILSSYNIEIVTEQVAQGDLNVEFYDPYSYKCLRENEGIAYGLKSGDTPSTELGSPANFLSYQTILQEFEEKFQTPSFDSFMFVDTTGARVFRNNYLVTSDVELKDVLELTTPSTKTIVLQSDVFLYASSPIEAKGYNVILGGRLIVQNTPTIQNDGDIFCFSNLEAHATHSIIIDGSATFSARNVRVVAGSTFTVTEQSTGKFYYERKIDAGTLVGGTQTFWDNTNDSSGGTTQETDAENASAGASNSQTLMSYGGAKEQTTLTITAGTDVTIDSNRCVYNSTSIELGMSITLSANLVINDIVATLQIATTSLKYLLYINLSTGDMYPAYANGTTIKVLGKTMVAGSYRLATVTYLRR